MSALGLTACGGALPPSPAPLAPPGPPPFEVVRAEAYTPPAPPPETGADPILHSAGARLPEVRVEVEAWAAVYTADGGARFSAYLSRMGRYAPLIDAALAERGLPASLRYLPIVESGFRPGAVSRAAAAGLWQFMAPVARGFGMQVDPLVDERRDPVRATPAALAFLEELHQRFGSWFLALAAYNAGPSRVERLLREHAPLAVPGDSLYLVLRPHLPRETREFVPRFLAAAAVADAPTRYGVEGWEPMPPLAYDEVVVPDATTLDVVAGAAGVGEEEIRALNPHLLRGVTPRGREVRIRVPPGRGEAFAEAYARIPPAERVTVTEHVVAPGETLSGIAQRYGIRTAELRSANPRVQERRMQVGTRLVVPLVPSRRE
ncbi:MAG: transglycosylase SLT domain-containing protein [Longimicrobiales bacterium]|nr:transglycosylase SLT domain-containing protein [Longimicrobiales bacterium]